MASDDLVVRLRRGDVVVGDGAWGTMIMARGLRAGQPPEAFNLTRAHELEAIAREYVEAGAQLITTNTFGASPLRLRLYGLEGETEAINQAAVRAVRRAVGDRAAVLASIGPSGRLMKPYGDTDPREVADGFTRQARALAAEGVDVFCVETMTDLGEAELAIRAAREAAANVPIVATMTFDRTRRGFFTVMGTSIAAAARGLVQAGADMVGSNCGNGLDAMIEIAQLFRASTSTPLAIQANAGLPETRGGTLVYPESPEFFAERVPMLVAEGVRLIGGCCGTTPDHIRAIRRAVDERGAGS